MHCRCEFVVAIFPFCVSRCSLFIVGRLGTVCVGRVGPVKDSLTYRPSSQGWALRVLLLCVVCVVECLVYVCFCVVYISTCTCTQWVWLGVFLFFLIYLLIARVLYTCFPSSNLCTCILLPCLYIPECMCICYSLGSNSISDEGARAVADGMKYCTSLKTLEWVTVQLSIM